jgi:four helix bundle protein
LAIGDWPESSSEEQVRNFENLEVWQMAHTLTVELYRLTETFPRTEIFGLTSQIRRASGSIGANLAEGCGRWGEVELARYVQIAMGSASELQNHLRLAQDLGFVNAADYDKMIGQLISIRKMLTALLQTLRRSQKHVAELSSGQEPPAKSQ